MAASGVAEHNEAQRKETVYLRKAFLSQCKQRGRDLKVLQNELELDSKSRRVMSPSTYTQEVERKLQLGLLTKHDAESVDKQRRMAHYKMMQEEYSAKLPNRYSSIDYTSQW